MIQPIQLNAYRVLGLTSDATRAQVRQAVNELKTRARVGGLGTVSDPFASLAPIVRTEAMISDAAHRLEKPGARVLERLFWFSARDPRDREALTAISRRDRDRALRTWNGSEAVTSRLNAAILTTAGAFHDPTSDSWEAALAAWDEVLWSNEIDEALAEMEVASGYDQTLDIGEIQTLTSEGAWTALVDLAEERLGRAIAEGNASLAGEISHAVSAYCPEDLSSRLEQRAFEPLVVEVTSCADEIDAALTEAKKTISESNTHAGELACRKALARYRTDLAPRLDRIRNLAGAESDYFIDANRAAVECLMSISIVAFNAWDAYEVSAESAEVGLLLPEVPLVHDRLREGLETILVGWIRHVTAHIREELDASCDRVPIASAVSMACEKALAAYDNTVPGLLERLRRVPTVDSESRRAAYAATAGCLRNISIELHNRGGNTERALAIARRALTASKGTSVEARLRDDCASLERQLVQARVGSRPSVSMPVTSPEWPIRPRRAAPSPSQPQTPTGMPAESHYIRNAAIAGGILLTAMAVAATYGDYANRQSQASNRNKSAVQSITNGNSATTSKAVNTNTNTSKPVAVNSNTGTSQVRNSVSAPVTPTYQPSYGGGDKSALSKELDDLKSQIDELADERDELKREMASNESQIKFYKGEIDRCERSMDLGVYVDRAAYQAYVASHNRFVDAYNELLGRVRAIDYKRSQLINEYNAKVREYNGER